MKYKIKSFILGVLPFMVGPPEEHIIWGENSPMALRAYPRG
jgi:hypothetical protein